MNEERSRLAGTAWAALLQVHAALVPRLDRALQQAAGLPLSWYDVLLELAAVPGWLRYTASWGAMATPVHCCATRLTAWSASCPMAIH